MHSLPPEQEPELIRRAAGGDQAAWTALVRLHQEPVFRLAYLLLGSAADAEDVAQEVFLRCFRALDRFDRAQPLRPWLLQITRNTASNWRRSLRRAWATMVRGSEPPQGPDGLDAATGDALWRAVRRLRADEQAVLYLRLFLELSVEETAAALNIAPGTVKSRLSRALERLRAAARHEFPELAESDLPQREQA